MTYSYDLTTAVGQVRNRIPDRVVEGAAHFSDEEIAAYLDLEDEDIDLAAAAACEAWATELAVDAHRVRTLDYEEDTTARARAMNERAASLRKVAGERPAFAVAEVAWGGLAGIPAEDIVVSAALRGEL